MLRAKVYGSSRFPQFFPDYFSPVSGSHPGYHSTFNFVVQSLSHVDPLRPHGLQHAKLLCPLPPPRAWANSCPLSWWCHPTISILCLPLLLLPSILIGLLKIVLIVAVCQTLSLICGIQKIKWINRTKQKQIHRYREHTSRCRWGKVGRDKGRETRQGVWTIMYKINKLWWYIVQHREYNQYFVTLNGV